MRTLRVLLGCTFAFFLLSDAAHAVPITLEITGQVTGLSGVLGTNANGFAAGDTVLWRLTYDPTVAGPAPAGSYPFLAGVSAASFDWSVTLSGKTYEWSNVGQSHLFADGTGSIIGFDTSISGAAVDGPSLSSPFAMFPVAFDALMQFSGAIAAPFVLPQSVPSSPLTGSFSLLFAPCDNCVGPSVGGVNGVLQSVQSSPGQVPEPSTLLLMSAGVAGPYRWRRVRR